MGCPGEPVNVPMRSDAKMIYTGVLYRSVVKCNMPKYSASLTRPSEALHLPRQPYHDRIAQAHTATVHCLDWTSCVNSLAPSTPGLRVQVSCMPLSGLVFRQGRGSPLPRFAEESIVPYPPGRSQHGVLVPDRMVRYGFSCCAVSIYGSAARKRLLQGPMTES